MNLLLQVAIEFFKTGLFAIGGGLATIPFLVDISNKYGWFSLDMLSTMIAISESTPGPIGVNMSTYVGYHVSGFLGALVSTLSLVAPSVIVVCIVSKMLEKFSNSKIIKNCFYGIKACVVALIIYACLTIFKTALFNVDLSLNLNAIILLIIELVIYHYFPKLHPIFFIIFSAIVGIIFVI